MSLICFCVCLTLVNLILYLYQIQLDLANLPNSDTFLLISPGALSLAITHPQFYWYVDETLTPDSLHSSLLRSEIHFGAPLPSFYSLQDRPSEQRQRFRDFVVQYADILAQQSTR